MSAAARQAVTTAPNPPPQITNGDDHARHPDATRTRPTRARPTRNHPDDRRQGGRHAGVPSPARLRERFLDQTTDVGADLAAALLDAIRDIHALCTRHRSHGNRAIPVVEVDIILGRRLRPHLQPTTVAADPEPSAGALDDTSEMTS